MRNPAWFAMWRRHLAVHPGEDFSVVLDVEPAAWDETSSGERGELVLPSNPLDYLSFEQDLWRRSFWGNPVSRWGLWSESAGDYPIGRAGPGHFGDSRAGLPHVQRQPGLRMGAMLVNGPLPKEVIQRIVRQNLGRFRLCYENGLRTNPELAGRVAVRFVIDRSGAVAVAQDGGSDMPDRGVIGCVVRGFQNLSFPEPDNAIVTVFFPIVFSPGE